MTTYQSYDRHLMDLLLGFQKSYTLIVAASLRLPDLIDEGANTVPALASRTGTNNERLWRMLRALDQLEILKLAPDGSLSLTELGKSLKSDRVDSPYWAALMLCGPQGQVWNLLEGAIRSDQDPFVSLTGMRLFELLKHDCDEANIFHKGMVAMYGVESIAVADAYDFSWATSVADIGGGNGHLLSGILRRYPNLHGFLFEQEHALKAAAHGEGGPLPGVSLIAGDFFDQISINSDVYILRHILHDWTDEECKRILRNCRSAMLHGSRLLVIEALADNLDPTQPTPWADLDMMLITGGKERTFREYQEMLAAVGFHRIELIQTQCSGATIIEASI